MKVQYDPGLYVISCVEGKFFFFSKDVASTTYSQPFNTYEDCIGGLLLWDLLLSFPEELLAEYDA